MDATSNAAQTSTPTAKPRISPPRIVLALMLATPLAFGLAFGGVEFFGSFPPVIIVSAAAATLAIAVLLVERRWMTIVATVGALVVLVLGAADPTPGSMTRPSLGLQMSWGHAARLAGLVGIIAGLGELRRLRSGRAGRLARAAPAAAVLALGLAVGVGATTQAALLDVGFAQGSTVVALTPDATLSIIEKQNAFVVDGAVAPGALVRIGVENQDDFIHSFTAEGIDVDNLGSTTTEILARAPSGGADWAFYCKYHPEMKGTIRIA